MYIQNNTLVFEIKPCTWCEGTGQREEIKRCPNDGKAQRGKACEHCSATTKNSHRMLSTGARIACSHCDGAGQVQERRSDYMPAEVWQALSFTVFRGHKVPEHADMLYSCSDYGEAFKRDDGAVLASVKASTSLQSRVCRDDGTLLTIGIFVGRGGYVVAAFDPAKGEPQPLPAPVAPEERPRVFGEIVAARVAELQSLGSGRWLKATGQWLVYGLERQIGFERGVDLCAAIERAWKAGEPLAPVAERLYREWTLPKQTQA